MTDFIVDPAGVVKDIRVKRQANPRAGDFARYRDVDIPVNPQPALARASVGEGLVTLAVAAALLIGVMLVDWIGQPKPVSGRSRAQAEKEAKVRDTISGVWTADLGPYRGHTSKGYPIEYYRQARCEFRGNQVEVALSDLPDALAVVDPRTPRRTTSNNAETFSIRIRPTQYRVVEISPTYSPFLRRSGRKEYRIAKEAVVLSASNDLFDGDYCIEVRGSDQLRLTKYRLKRTTSQTEHERGPMPEELSAIKKCERECCAGAVPCFHFGEAAIPPDLLAFASEFDIIELNRSE